MAKSLFTNETSSNATQSIQGGKKRLTPDEIAELARTTEKLIADFKEQKSWVTTGFVFLCVTVGLAITGMALTLFAILSDYWNTKNQSYNEMVTAVQSLNSKVQLECLSYEPE